MAIPQETIDRIKHAADIVQVAQALGYEVTRKGQYHFIVCPFHPLDSAGDGGSCQLNQKGSSQKQRFSANWYYCHACKARGNVFALFAHAQGIDPNADFPLSVRGVANLVGLEQLLGDDHFEGGCETLAAALKTFGLSPAKGLKVPTPTGHTVLPRWHVDDVRALAALDESLSFSPDKLFDDAPPTGITVQWLEEGAAGPGEIIVVPEIGAGAIRRPDGSTCGVILPTRRLGHARQFTRGRGTSKLIDGRRLLGLPVEARTPLFALYYAVESPLEYLALRRAGLPASWGIWGGGAIVEGPARSISPGVIPVVVGIHFGAAPTGPQRMTRVLSAHQRWVPRQLWSALPTLWGQPNEVVLGLLRQATSHSTPLPATVLV